MFPVALLLLLAAGSYVKCEQLTQPASVTVQPGQRLTITCQVTYSVGTYGTAWIRQPAGKGLEWIGWKYTGDSYYKDSLKNKFSIDLDSSSNTVTLNGQNVQPEDSAVYYCARDGYWGAFDYWGKGTMVTVSSESTTPAQPTVFPLLPCSSGTGETVTLGCLASGFTPATVTFSWTKGTDALQDFIQYPSMQQGSAYTGVSQVQVTRQDWDNRQEFKCLVQHTGGNGQVILQKTSVYYKSPNLTVSSSEEGDKATFSCFAKDFSPKDFELKWLKNNVAVTTGDVQTMACSERKQVSGETVYSVASFLTVPVAQLDDTPFTCQFKGKGENGADVLIPKNSTAVIKDNCQNDAQACPEPDADISIIGPTGEDMLLNRKGILTCQVVVKVGKFEEMLWEKGGSEVAGSVMKNRNGKTGTFTSTTSITYDEWVSGTKFVCSVKLEDWLEPEKRHYVRFTGGQVVRPSVFMLPPVEHIRKNEVTLTCYVKDFYPQEVFVSWLVDDEVPDSTFDFNTTEPIKSNGLYSTYGQLSMNVTQWQQTDVVYSCAVYHQSVANTTKAIIRSIGYRTFENTNIVNLNMNVPDTCRAQ